MNETLKVLETRRSCRNFKPDMVSDEEILTFIISEKTILAVIRI
jgi:nitroreductase